MYQYFPNQNSLRVAALHRHLESLSAALEALCARHRGKSLATLAHDFAAGWVDLKIVRVADRLALHGHMVELDMEQAKMAVFARTELALADLLLSAPDAGFADPRSTAVAMLGDMHAVTWPALVRAQDPARLARLGQEIAGLARHHMGVTRAASASIEMRIA